ncbi:MAG: hypothetical protein K0S44_2772 [Bacteroidetes bacterium]|jgi:hypothetical protein|nr:hypothetical protein [Bacteroidota bacterium]
MNFHLEFPLSSFPDKINHSDTLMFIGSCFSENIGERMRSLKFSVNMNPHGILYNPLAITKALNRCAKGALMKEEELFFANECWNSWEHHSRFSEPDKMNCLSKINDSISQAHADVKKTRWLFLTFGTAFSYTLKDAKISVGNCHKIPQQKFIKDLLKPESIIEQYTKLISDLKEINPLINIVFTVSPVRYIRDGVVENNLSKAVLIQSVHELVRTHSNAFYFPSYELVIDDLRDYRFYEEDLVHPNDLAIDYVFEKLTQSCFTEETISVNNQIKEIRNAAAHKPFNENSQAHRKFKLAFLKKCEDLKRLHPQLHLNAELEFFRK